MATKLTPMIHVPDVRAAADWYVALGFALIGYNPTCSDTEVWDWAALRLGPTGLMFNLGGQSSEAPRREVDLYIDTDALDVLWSRLRDRAEIVEPPHATEYGRREFIIRDLNRFWITFGQPVAR
ncbi:hypothetical protein E2493_12315 [Sphingomonas parva]|uniref:Glyoxalase/fosfomycin resistance/dioxygenase domain-containing protein n=1 Tax=Sphingomonas parva TaxID=2555898 RepID=A0A4Y8ZPP5_9SPHN|nr:VOC family protein [Sphingomonas parva]TFI57973.1 hypothetical protein E2493_12315 [Sphingomonas parva]